MKIPLKGVIAVAALLALVAPFTVASADTGVTRAGR